ncbi:hypothetical protein C6P45_004096 [Maudiozyma exigua]|uniref:Uncharacterized protein n=1 Tax=Maudiozyma exigua TaxID=34358 RepID=A0A9P6WEK4_MAUEX|nr:hypothetical protein C6P45_004096 [Kazachstania exigua]
MTTNNENSYFESLCEMDQVLQSNHEVLQETMQILEKLTNDSANDVELLKYMELLHQSYDSLLESSTDLRYSKYQTREHQVSNVNKMDIENREYIIGRKTWPDLRQYITLLDGINKDSIAYANLLNKLSVELVKQIDISDPQISEIVFDKWKPPAELQTIVDNYYESDTGNNDMLSDQLTKYFNSIKLSRAKYILQNKYMLQRHLTELNKEVNYWRGELDNIEMLLFGDGPHSIRRTLQTVDKLKAKLNTEAKN